jgi:hypothetical protein
VARPFAIDAFYSSAGSVKLDGRAGTLLKPVYTVSLPSNRR